MRILGAYSRHLWEEALFSLWPLKMVVLCALLFLEILILDHAPVLAQQPPPPHLCSTGAAWTDALLRLLTWTVGPLDRWLLISLAFLVAWDFILGTLRALCAGPRLPGKWTKERFGQSLLKVFMYYMALALIWRCRQWTGTGEVYFQTLGWVVSRVLEAYLITYETVSVMENLAGFAKECAKTDLPVVPRLIEWLKRNLDTHTDQVLGTGADVYKVLLIEDDDQFRALVWEYLMVRPLSHVRYELIPTDSLKMGIELARAMNFDVVLLDLTLRDSLAPETYTLFIRALEVRELPVVVLIGNDDPQVNHLLLRAGARDFLPKDSKFSQRRLEDRIMRVAEEQRRLQAILSEPERKAELAEISARRSGEFETARALATPPPEKETP